MAGAGVIAVGAIDDDQMLLDGLSAWLRELPDLLLVAQAGSVEDYLSPSPPPVDVVLLDLRLGDGSDPEHNVRRLVGVGARVLVVSQSREPGRVCAVLDAGARGYLTKDHDLPALAAAVRDVAAGRLALTPELAFVLARDRRPGRPHLSAQERTILVYYASGMTLEAAARRAGIRPTTAKGYLERIKAKYREAGRATYTKLDLAARAREDEWL